MNCPRCQSPLNERERDGVVLDLCPSCRGIWLDRGELEKLAFEIDKLTREVRAAQPAIDDLPAVQLRNRKLSRLTGAISQLRSYQVRFR